jgi:mannosyltransferase OCH1-like enzyme
MQRPPDDHRNFRRIASTRRGDPGRRRFQKIPFTVYQTFRTADVPDAMFDAVSSWRALNPEYDHEFYDDARVADYILKEFPVAGFSFDRQRLLAAFAKIRPGAGKADLFRYLIIYDRGGVYMDVDTTCLKPLSSFIRPEDDVVTGLGRRGDFHQWGLIYSSRHPFMRAAVEIVVANIVNETFVGGFTTLEGIGGPPCLDHAIKTVLRLPPAFQFGPGAFDFAEGNRVYRCRIIAGDFFGNTVGFKYPQYLRDLERMQVPYWASEELFNR